MGGKREEVEFNIFRTCLLFDLNCHEFLNYDSSNLSYYKCSLLTCSKLTIETLVQGVKYFQSLK